MKISIVTQYYNRRNQFLKTLNSFKDTSFPLSDLEIIIVDDASNEEHQITDIIELFPEIDIKIYSFIKEDKWWSCPVIPINKGLSMATGDVIVLHCAECMFIGDVLLDISNRIKSNDYLVYGTLSIPKELSEAFDHIPYDYLKTNPFISVPGSCWYQHSQKNNNCYNFCTAILREDLLNKLGGFDERFAFGFDSGDLDFIRRVKEIGMNVISIDDPLTYHQWHPPYLWSEFIERTDVSNLSGYSLYDYIVKNEPNNYKVNNSFIGNENFIPKKPELSVTKKLVDFDFNISTYDEFFFEFKCPYSNIKVDLIVNDSNGSCIYNSKVNNNSWISFKGNVELFLIEISHNQKIIMSLDIEKNHQTSFLMKKYIDIYVHF